MIFSVCLQVSKLLLDDTPILVNTVNPPFYLGFSWGSILQLQPTSPIVNASTCMGLSLVNQVCSTCGIQQDGNLSGIENNKQCTYLLGYRGTFFRHTQFDK